MEFKYLAIKNWDKYQPRRGKSSWVKDWTDKDADAGYMKLTAFQRYILDGCRRLRGRFGKNVNNDPTYIARALNMLSTERARVGNTIRTLTEQGFLVLTNQEDDSLDKNKKQDKEEEKDIETPRAPQTTKEPSEFTGDDLVFEVLRQMGVSARNPELTVVVSDALNIKAREPTWNIQLAARHFIERGKAYKASPIWNTQYKTSWLKWFQNQCYDQDPSAWAEKSANGKREQVATEQHRTETRAAVAAGVDKFLRGKNGMGGNYVPTATAAKSGNSG